MSVDCSKDILEIVRIALVFVTQLATDLTGWFSKAPSDATLSKLSTYLRKAQWDDGQQSLVYLYRMVESRLPLWVVQYWILALESIIKVSRWKLWLMEKVNL